MKTNTTADMQAWVIWFKSVTSQQFTEAAIHLGKFRSALPRWGGGWSASQNESAQLINIFSGRIFTASWVVRIREVKCLHQVCGIAVITKHLWKLLVHCASASPFVRQDYTDPLLPLSLHSPGGTQMSGGISKLYQWALTKFTAVLWWVTPWKCL